MITIEPRSELTNIFLNRFLELRSGNVDFKIQDTESKEDAHKMCNVLKETLYVLINSAQLISLTIRSTFLSPQVLNLIAHFLTLNQSQFICLKILNFDIMKYNAFFKHESKQALYLNYTERALGSIRFALHRNHYIQIAHIFMCSYDENFNEFNPDNFSHHDEAEIIENLEIFDRHYIFDFKRFENVSDTQILKELHEIFPDIYDKQFLLEYNPNDPIYQPLSLRIHELQNHPSLQDIQFYDCCDNDYDEEDEEESRFITLRDYLRYNRRI